MRFLIICGLVIINCRFLHAEIQQIWCNPLDLNYRLRLEAPSRREAADPVILLFKGSYYLFASKAGGYWSSPDLLTWSFITTPELPLEDYAPAAAVIGDAVYFMASFNERRPIYRSADPASGHWETANPLFPFPVSDPALFCDDDGRIFLYWGLGRNGPIRGIELDAAHNLNPLGSAIDLITGDTIQHGWERRGDNNELADAPYIEGAWMTKHDGHYYLQYAAPGTQFRGYADGVYVSNRPLGPFVYGPNNPFSIKPAGFISGAGHGCTFQDMHGQWWHVSTMVIAEKHKFERRLGLFPAGFDASGVLFVRTGMADYPHRLDDLPVLPNDRWLPAAMLLSDRCPITASSSQAEHPPDMAVDENVKTYWVPSSLGQEPWLQVDLGPGCTVESVQVNFAEHEAHRFGWIAGRGYRYKVAGSSDGSRWTDIVDRTNATRETPHNFDLLTAPVKARYVRVVFLAVPEGRVAVSGVRVFGRGSGVPPAVVTGTSAARDPNDSCSATVRWAAALGATGYLLRFGEAPDKLYQSQEVLNGTKVVIHRLNRDQNYFFAVDAFNHSGFGVPGPVMTFETPTSLYQKN